MCTCISQKECVVKEKMCLHAADDAANSAEQENALILACIVIARKNAQTVILKIFEKLEKLKL